MKLPWQKDADQSDAARSDSTDDDASTVDIADDEPAKPAPTPGKGRPTPKRSEAQNKRRGPVTPAPLTRAEARARKKELKSTVNLSKEEKKELSDKRRQQRVEQREKMMSGEEKYLMPRDQGEVKRYVRDIIDSRRNFAGLFMPFAIVLILVMFMPNLAIYATPLMLVFVLFLVIDGIILGRIVNNRVRERFPNATEGGFKLGWYSFTRAMQLRKMRAPRPKVKPGDAV